MEMSCIRKLLGVLLILWYRNIFDVGRRYLGMFVQACFVIAKHNLCGEARTPVEDLLFPKIVRAESFSARVTLSAQPFLWGFCGGAKA